MFLHCLGAEQNYSLRKENQSLRERLMALEWENNSITWQIAELEEENQSMQEQMIAMDDQIIQLDALQKSLEPGNRYLNSMRQERVLTTVRKLVQDFF